MTQVPVFNLAVFVHFCSLPKDKLIFTDEHGMMLRAEQEAAQCLSEWVFR